MVEHEVNVVGSNRIGLLLYSFARNLMVEEEVNIVETHAMNLFVTALREFHTILKPHLAKSLRSWIQRLC